MKATHYEAVNSTKEDKIKKSREEWDNPALQHLVFTGEKGELICKCGFIDYGNDRTASVGKEEVEYLRRQAEARWRNEVYVSHE